MDKAPDAFRTISEVADDLDLPQHVLRFWESRFAQIKPMKRGGGRRYYRPEDVDLLRGIRHLLYGEGYTIKGVQRILREEGVKFVQTVWQDGAVQPPNGVAPDEGEVSPHRGARLREQLEARHDVRDDGEGADEDDLVESDGDDEDAEEADDSRERIIPMAPLGTAEHAAATSATAPSRRAGLSREDLRTLQTTLHELTECRRLIEAAFNESS